MKFLPFLIILALLVGLITLNKRGKSRASVTEARRTRNLHPGLEVMTTSGLYATIVSVNADDGTARLSISPGVEVKWSIAALRQMDELPNKYRDAIKPPPEAGTSGADGAEPA